MAKPKRQWNADDADLMDLRGFKTIDFALPYPH